MKLLPAATVACARTHACTHARTHARRQAGRQAGRQGGRQTHSHLVHSPPKFLVDELRRGFTVGLCELRVSALVRRVGQLPHTRVHSVDGDHLRSDGRHLAFHGTNECVCMTKPDNNNAKWAIVKTPRHVTVVRFVFFRCCPSFLSSRNHQTKRTNRRRAAQHAWMHAGRKGRKEGRKPVGCVRQQVQRTLRRSSDAPVVILPKMISSAARPPKAMHIMSSNCSVF